jgi:hypothetical protein
MSLSYIHPNRASTPSIASLSLSQARMVSVNSSLRGVKELVRPVAASNAVLAQGNGL